MWESQVLLMDGQVVFHRVLCFFPPFDKRSTQYRWNICVRAVKSKYFLWQIKIKILSAAVMISALLKAFIFQPGKRSLLLNQLVSGGTSNERLSKHNTSDNKTRIRVERQAGKTVKRKLLSPAQQRITDSQRQRAIDLYRKMKDQRIKPRWWHKFSEDSDHKNYEK